MPRWSHLRGPTAAKRPGERAPSSLVGLRKYHPRYTRKTKAHTRDGGKFLPRAWRAASRHLKICLSCKSAPHTRTLEAKAAQGVLRDSLWRGNSLSGSCMCRSKVQAVPAVLTPGSVCASPGMPFAALGGVHVGMGSPFPELSVVTMATQPKHLEHRHIYRHKNSRSGSACIFEMLLCQPWKTPRVQVYLL